MSKYREPPTPEAIRAAVAEAAHFVVAWRAAPSSRCRSEDRCGGTNPCRWTRRPASVRGRHDWPSACSCRTTSRHEGDNARCAAAHLPGRDNRMRAGQPVQHRGAMRKGPRCCSHRPPGADFPLSDALQGAAGQEGARTADVSCEGQSIRSLARADRVLRAPAS